MNFREKELKHNSSAVVGPMSQSCPVPSLEPTVDQRVAQSHKGTGGAVVARQGTQRAQWGARGQGGKGEKSLAGVPATRCGCVTSHNSVSQEFLPIQANLQVEKPQCGITTPLSAGGANPQLPPPRNRWIPLSLKEKLESLQHPYH